MGTSHEWIRVLEMGGIFGAATLLLDALTQREKVLTWSNIIATAIASVGFGMMLVFEWRVLHGWIAAFFIIAVLTAFGAGFIIRRARNRSNIR